MKVLIVAPQPFFRERGTPIAVRLLAEMLCDMGHQVDLLVFHCGEDITYPNLRLVRAGRPPGVGDVPIGASWQKLVCDLALIWKLIQLLRRESYDVVHAVEEAVFPAALLTAFTRSRLIYDMDSSMADQLTDKWRALKPLQKFLEAVEFMAVRQASVVLAVCEDLAAKVRPWVRKGRVMVLPDVPVGDTSPRPIESLRELAGKGAVIGLYVGNLEHYQGIDLLVDAVTLVPTSVNFQMIVIGGSPADVARYRQRTEALGLENRLRFLGPRPLSNLNSYLCQADLLISPRILGQNTPMKIYSYMQSGRAILATDIRSHTQALDRSCAELVEAHPEALAAAVRRLATNPERRQQLGTAAREIAEREYSLGAYRRKLRKAYEHASRAVLHVAASPLLLPCMLFGA